MGDRPKIPPTREADVVVGSRRRCCLCFALDGDATEKKGQIAHLDQDAANNAPENLAFLCLLHHDEYDTRTSVSKGLTEAEVKRYRQALLSYLADQAPTPDTQPERMAAVSLELYDRRLPVYNAATDFITAMLKMHRIDDGAFAKFYQATHEAPFLFDAGVAAYLADLYRRGLRLRALDLTLSGPEGRARERVDEQQELVAWFLQQYDEVTARLAPFFRVS